MAPRRAQHRTNLVLAALVVLAAAGALWSRRQVPDAVREDRRGRVLPALRRERITRLEVSLAGGERYELRKDAAGGAAAARGDAPGRWELLTPARRFGADEPEVERLLTEAEFASPVRRLGPLDAAARARFGLATPRARVALAEGAQPTARFAIGGLVADEPAAYAEVDGQGYVVPKTFADAFVQRAMELRERTLSSLEPSRVARLALEGEGGGRVLERAGAVWRLAEPAEERGGRASRARVEAALHGLRDLRATRFLADEADEATLARYGLAPPRLLVRATRDRGGAASEFRFGGACDGRDDEVTVVRGGERTVACVGRAVFEDLSRPAGELRDDRLVWARTDEVERARVRGAPGGDFSLVRAADGWRMEGGPAEADGEAVESWLNVLGGLVAEARLPAGSAAAHGLAPPPAFSIELSRTGVEGVERLNVGAPDADRMYASRDDEPLVLGLEPSAAEALRVDPARFRPRRLLRDVPDELAALLTEAPEFRDEAMRVEGAWRLVRPLSALADPSAVRAAAQRLASLGAERWVGSRPLPLHGLAAPRLRVVARFEGAGPEPEPAADGGGPARGDAAAGPRVREYTLRVGAPAPGGGFYAALDGREGVFVLGTSAYADLAQPHLDRNVLETDRTRALRVEITRPRARGAGVERVVLRREGEAWRTEAGTPADRARVQTLLEQLALVRAPRVFGYGAPPAAAQLGAVTLAVTQAPPGEGGAADAGATATTRLSLGASFGAGDDAAVYARRDGLDATLSVPQALADALRDFTP